MAKVSVSKQRHESKGQSLEIPVRKSYRPKTQETCPSQMPFVKGKKNGVIHEWWSVPEGTDDYAHACRIGSEYACHYIQYLSDNPSMVGFNFLGKIAADVNFSESGKNGFHVGFFSHLESLLCMHLRQFNVFKDLDRRMAFYDEKMAELEAQEKKEIST